VTPPTQVELDQAARDLKAAELEYEAAVRLLNAASPATTLENAVIIQRKNDAWNALEEARRRFRDVHTRAAHAGVGKG
jgi:2-keto-4-pentenoate hydratase